MVELGGVGWQKGGKEGMGEEVEREADRKIELDTLGLTERGI
jgi:hypothetical protein